MTTNPSQLFLLADHVKLSLLERQRATTLDPQSTKQEVQISRSLDSLGQGIEALERHKFNQEAAGEDITDIADQITRLRSQHNDLTSDFKRTTTPSTTTNPSDPSLSLDSSTTRSRPQYPRSSSLRKPNPRSPNSKAVRFHDDPSDAQPYTDSSDASRALLFDRPYSDDAPDTADEQPEQDNLQIHARHKQVLRDQDEQLDTLGASIGRQRVLGLQMGNELDEQGLLLQDVERGVDRHAGTLDRARERLGKISRKAKGNWSWVTIGCLIVVLVLLIVLLK